MEYSNNRNRVNSRSIQDGNLGTDEISHKKNNDQNKRKFPLARPCLQRASMIMRVQDFLENYENLSSFPGIKNKPGVFAWFESQGSNIGIRALGFRCGSPNKEADELNLNKDGRSRRGTPTCVRPVSNAKRRGLKGLPKSQIRLSIRF